MEMSKKPNKKPSEKVAAVRVPQFDPGTFVAGGMPAVVTDKYGTLWRVCPHTGTAKEVTFR
jgi:hypothetical protein